MSLFRSVSSFKKQGDVGMAAAIFWATRNNFTVSLPLTDSQDYDLLVDTQTAIERVQVRTATQVAKSGSFVVNLRVTGGNRSGLGKSKVPDDMGYDALFVVTSTGDTYYIPKHRLAGMRSTLTLNEAVAAYKAH